MSPLVHSTRIKSLRYTLSRYDQYFDNVNNKASFVLALATVLIGGLGAFVQNHNWTEYAWWFWIPVAIAIGASAWAIKTTLRSITPYTVGGSTSLLYYGSVCQFDLGELQNKVLNQTEENEIDDYVRQVHFLSKGLSNKFRRLREACISLLVAFAAIVVAVAMLLFIQTPNT